MDDLGNCKRCKRPLIEIDDYGEPLIICIGGNRWGKPDDENLVMELMEDDLEALKASAEKVMP